MMTKEEFLDELADVLQRDDYLDYSMRLKDLDEWDSLSIMGVTALLDRKFGKRVSFDDIKAMQTVADIANVAGITL